MTVKEKLSVASITENQSPTQRLMVSVKDATELILAKAVHQLFGFITNGLSYEIDGGEQGQYLRDASEHLQQGGNLLVAFAPHNQTLDPEIIIHIVHRALRTVTPWPWAVVASAKFQLAGAQYAIEGFSGELKIPSLIMESVNQSWGLEPFYFVQNYALQAWERQLVAAEMAGDETQIAYWIDRIYRAKLLAKHSTLGLLDFMRQSSSIVLVSPEATRGGNAYPDGFFGLNRADDAVSLAKPRKGLTNTKIFPLVIGGVPELEIDPKQVPARLATLARDVSLGRLPPITAQFGPLATYEELKQEAQLCQWTPAAVRQINANPKAISVGNLQDFTPTDALMRRMVGMLPGSPSYQQFTAGYYRDSNLTSRGF